MLSRFSNLLLTVSVAFFASSALAEDGLSLPPATSIVLPNDLQLQYHQPVTLPAPPPQKTEVKPIQRRDGFIPLDRKKMIVRPLNRSQPMIIRPKPLGGNITNTRRKEREKIEDTTSPQTRGKPVIDIFVPDESAQ